MSLDNSQQQKEASTQCNVQLPTNLVSALKSEAHRLTGHKKRGFSNLLAICARCGWDVYQRGELAVERQPQVISYRLVKGE